MATKQAAPTLDGNGIDFDADDHYQSFFKDRPYFRAVNALQNSFPALKPFLNKIINTGECERKIVRDYYQSVHHRSPGRCVCLIFEDDKISYPVDYEHGFKSAKYLDEYLTAHPAAESRRTVRRLFILEDLEVDYMEALGYHLGVDPLVFCQQTNTLNYVDSWSIQNRALPSMLSPEESWSLRYYELRTLREPESIHKLTMQMTFAMNRRRYERWRDIDVPSAKQPDRRHGFVRRATSFWTSQKPNLAEGDTMDASTSNPEAGWDAVIMVDPGMAAACKTPNTFIPTGPGFFSRTATARPQNQDSFASGAEPDIYIPLNDRRGPSRRQLAAVLDRREQWPDPELTYILGGQPKFSSRAELWNAQGFQANRKLVKVEHESWPYHLGCSTLEMPSLLRAGKAGTLNDLARLHQIRDLVSPFDEMVFYWTKIAPTALIRATAKHSSNTTFYLLKHIAQHWIHQLELINTSVSKGEWFADDYQVILSEEKTSLQEWAQELRKINETVQDINYMRRHLNAFWRAMIINLEAIGVQLGNEGVDENAPAAIQDVQKDFITIHNRMQPLRDRAEALSSIGSDLINVRAAIRGVHDAEFSMRLSLFASIVFPLTLVAGIFSMNDAWLPGAHKHFELWALGLPLCAIVALVLMYGKQPWLVFRDFAGYGILWWEARKDSKNEKLRRKQEAADLERLHGENQGATRSVSDEEQARAGAQAGPNNA